MSIGVVLVKLAENPVKPKTRMAKKMTKGPSGESLLLRVSIRPLTSNSDNLLCDSGYPYAAQAKNVQLEIGRD